MNTKVEGLFKNDLKHLKPSDNRKFLYSKRKINGICKSLKTETNVYDVRKTIQSIQSYLDEPQKLERILYSEISNYIFGLDMAERGVFATNIEKLLLYSLEEDNTLKDDCKKIIIKIYDHFQLSSHQIENASKIFENSVSDVKININREIKSIEKEYISILGIFAAIVLAFVGGITFSSSILENIHKASAYRILLIVDLLGLVLINVMYLLVKFIFVINEKDTKQISIKWINIICITLAGLTLLGWFLDIVGLSKFIQGNLPWK